MARHNPEEGVDYYINDAGLLVFTEHFLRLRGFCCGSGCLHCPYNYEKVPSPKRELLLEKRTKAAGGK